MYKKMLEAKHTWLVPGGAGFIGSHIIDALLKHNQNIICLDNLSACGTKNLEYLKTHNTKNKFEFIEGDIRDPQTCDKVCQSADFVLHHAAIGSVPRSFEDPNYVDHVNVGGFLNILAAAAKHNVKKFIYASSSAVYGDYTEDKNKESQPVKPLSPYAVGKCTNELYAQTLSAHYGMECIGLRYFNIYGPRQDPNGAYAAVIPRWIDKIKNEDPIEIYGDGSSVRDFCYVEDVVEANILSALPSEAGNFHHVYNVGSGQQASLKELLGHLQTFLSPASPIYKEARTGDIQISCADINLIKKELGFSPKYHLKDGLEKTISDI